AVAGVGGVFAVPPAAFRPDGWDVDLEAERGERLIEAARGAGVEHVVFTSIATTTGPTIPGTAGKERIEAALRGSGMRHTVLRPVRFMENYLFTDTPVDGIHGGVHRHLFRADRPMQVIAVADIAVFAALAFADPDRYDGETLELAGDAPTPVEAAAAVGAAIGAEVRYERVTAEEAKALGEEIVQTWELHEAGHAWKADIPALRRLHPGLRTLEDWLAEGGADAIGRR
ncbi:NmrA family NAD(P)-binding protein, partial [Glycomyces tenuis]